MSKFLLFTTNFIRRRRSNDIFVVFVVIVLSGSHVIHAWVIVTRWFGKGPTGQFLPLIVFNLVVSWSRGIRKYHWALHISGNNSSNFGKVIYFWLILTGSRNLILIFQVQSRSKSESWFLLTSIFKHSILIFIRSRPRIPVFIFSISWIFAEIVSFFINNQRRVNLILSGSGLILHFLIFSSFHPNFKSASTKMKALYLLRALHQGRSYLDLFEIAFQKFISDLPCWNWDFS